MEMCMKALKKSKQNQKPKKKKLEPLYNPAFPLLSLNLYDSSQQHYSQWLGYRIKLPINR